MAQFYNLEEAARVLGMEPDELKQKAQHREVRAFMDSGSWRFRVADIDELARRRGMGSDPDLSLSDSALEAKGADSDSDIDVDLSDFQLGATGEEHGPMSMDVPAVGEAGSSEHDILLDDASLPQEPQSGSSSHIIGMESAGKLPSDSDVRLVPDAAKGSSDSDVQLSGEQPTSPPRPSDSDVTLVQEGTSGTMETFGVDEESGSDSSGETTLRPSPVDSSDEIKAADSGSGQVEEDSDFELTPSSVIDALQPDSGSDFELTALDGSDEFESTPSPPKPSDSDVTGAEPSTSGVNLGQPSDSGINLQSVGSLDMGEEDSIELAPLDDEAKPAPKKPAAKAKAKPAEPKSDPSATALPTRGDKDIFDDTDFEVDALSGSDEDQTVQLEAQSDFDLEESESGSEVFALDEEDVDQNAATAMGPAVLEEEDALVESAEETSAEIGDAGWEEEEEEDVAAPAAARAPAASPMLAASTGGPEWGGLWVGLLGLTSVLLLLLTFISLDVVRNLNAYQGDTPVASGLVKMIAGGD